MTLATIISAVAAIVAASLGAWNRAKIQEVHVLVNAQLSEVMAKLEKVTAERDHLDPGKPG